MDRNPSPARTRLIRKIAIDLAIMTVIGIILALIGPFGSFEDPLPVRLMVWVGFSYLGYAFYSPMGPLVDRLHIALDLPRAWLWVAACMAATVPMSLAVWSLRFAANPAALRMPGLETAMINYFYVLVIGGGVTLLFNALGSRPYGEDDTGLTPEGVSSPKGEEAELRSELLVPLPEKSGQPRFIARLPAELGSQLIALEMEDHYVRAHTALGSDLVLMRMRDAVAELDGTEGMQVHRSWWVARGAIADVKREGRNVRLVLDGGLEAPVSRANVVPLKDAGWI